MYLFLINTYIDFQEEDHNILNISDTIREINEIEEAPNKKESSDNKDDENINANNKHDSLSKKEDKSFLKNNNNFKDDKLDNISKILSKAEYDEEDSVNIATDKNNKITDNYNNVNISVQRSINPVTSIIKKHDHDISDNRDNKIRTETSDIKSMKSTTNKKNDSNLNNILNLLDDNNQNDYLNDHYFNNNPNSVVNEIIPSSAEILNMVLELKESKKTTSEMKALIEDLRKDNKEKEESHTKKLKEVISSQKHEYDTTFQRMQSLIDNLVLEKKKLLSANEDLEDKLEQLEKNEHKNLKQMMENFELERKKDKDAWFQAEKIRRKKWEENKIEEIKSTTIKGLEPEIDSIIHKHKLELEEKEDLYEKEYKNLKNKLMSDYERKVDDLKRKLLEEKEEALEHEKSLALQKIRNNSDRLEDQLNEERRRWSSNLTSEIQRIETLRRNDQELHDKEKITMEDRYKKILEEKDNYYKNLISDIEKRQSEKANYTVEDMKLKLEKERDLYVEQKLKEFEEKYREYKMETIKNRDKEIEIIAQKLSNETINEKRKYKNEAEDKADIINKQLKTEVEQLRHKVSELSDKLNGETKVRVLLDDNQETLNRKLQECQREVTKKEKLLLETGANLSEISMKYNNVVKEFQKEQNKMESEYKSKMKKIEEDNRVFNDKLENMKYQYENKITEINKKHESDIELIEQKIQSKKLKTDELHIRFNEEIQKKNYTIKKYEDLLAQQRTDLLMKDN